MPYVPEVYAPEVHDAQVARVFAGAIQSWKTEFSGEHDRETQRFLTLPQGIELGRDGVDFPDNRYFTGVREKVSGKMSAVVYDIG